MKSFDDIQRDKARIAGMKKLTTEEWNRQHAGSVGSRREIIARYNLGLRQDIARRVMALKTSANARALFDDLGGAAQWKDAKLDWEYED